MTRAALRAAAAVRREVAAADDRAAAADRAWFAEHQGRNLRLRRRLPGEIPAVRNVFRLVLVWRGLAPHVWRELAEKLSPAELLALDGRTRTREPLDYSGESPADLARRVGWADGLADDGPLNELFRGLRCSCCGAGSCSEPAPTRPSGGVA